MNDFEKLEQMIKDHTADDLTRFHTIGETLRVLKESNDRQEEKLDKVLDTFKGFGFMGKVLIKAGLGATAVSAIFAMIYMVMGFFKKF